MIFAILFVLVFLVGAITYHYTSQWWHGVALASVLFSLNVISDTAAREYWLISLIFGLPIVFVAALLGAYVVEQRRTIHEVAETDHGGDSSIESPSPPKDQLND